MFGTHLAETTSKVTGYVIEFVKRSSPFPLSPEQSSIKIDKSFGR
jgi:hypothetical protein